MDAAILEAADHAARRWTSRESGPLQPGTEAHRNAVCAMFQETFNPYKPSVIDWPKLDANARDRLITLPIWDIAVQTEGRAARRMQAYADSVQDPQLRAAITLNAWEERRHREVLADLVQAYGISLAPEPEYRVPHDTEWAYLVTGFSECIDSFFAFGLFALAKRSGFFPAELVDTFEPVIQEEARHILLFANWVALHRRTMRRWARPWFELRVFAVWIFLFWERLAIAQRFDGNKPEDNNFAVSGSKAVSDVDVSTSELMDLCLAENERRFAGYDDRLLRPTTMPSLVRFARRFMRGKPR